MQPHQPYDAAPKQFYQGLEPGYQGPLSDRRKIRRIRGRRDINPEDVRRLERLYEGNLRYPDWVLGELAGALRRRGVLERSVFVLSSDHGESLGERGWFGHGHGVDRELVPIPLLVRLPSRFGLTGRREAPVGSVDVLPTVLQLLGVRMPDAIDGRSFRDILEGRPDRARWPRPVLAWAGGRRAATVAAYGAGFKYSFDNVKVRERLFTAEEEEDGADLRKSRPISFDYLAFSSYLPDTASVGSMPAGEAPPLDAESLEALRALGYVE